MSGNAPWLRWEQPIKGQLRLHLHKAYPGVKRPLAVGILRVLPVASPDESIKHMLHFFDYEKQTPVGLVLGEAQIEALNTALDFVNVQTTAGVDEILKRATGAEVAKKALTAVEQIVLQDAAADFQTWVKLAKSAGAPK